MSLHLLRLPQVGMIQVVFWGENSTVIPVPNSVKDKNLDIGGGGSDKTKDKSPVLPPHEFYQPPPWPRYYAALPRGHPPASASPWQPPPSVWPPYPPSAVQVWSAQPTPWWPPYLHAPTYYHDGFVLPPPPAPPPPPQPPTLATPAALV